MIMRRLLASLLVTHPIDVTVSAQLPHFAKLTDIAGSINDLYGWSINAHRGQLAIGAPSDCVPRQHGIVSIREWDGKAFTDAVEIHRSVCTGHVLDLDGTRVLVGNRHPDNHRFWGEAVLLEFDGSSWTTVQSFHSESAVDDEFGFAVALEGSRVVVGAPRANKVQVFEQTTAGWQKTATLTIANLASTDPDSFD